MELTAKQEAFAQAIAGGMNQSDAYRTAYNAGHMKDEAIWVNASKVASGAKVALRIESLKAAIADKQLWTREDSVRALREVANKDEARGAEIVAAIKELNSMHGFNAPVKLDLKGDLMVRRAVDLTDDELAAIVTSSRT